MTEHKKPIYHQSEINTFLRCGKQWYFRYVEKIKTPPKAALTVGKAVDNAVTANLQEKIKTGSLLDTEAVLDTYSSTFDKEAIETEWGDDDKGQQKDIGVQLTKAHCDTIAPLIEPRTVQEEFLIKTNAEYDLGGTFDVIETADVVVDTKTAKQKYSDDAIQNEIQPILYTFAAEALYKRPFAFRYDILIKPTKTIGARTQQIYDTVSQSSKEFLFDTIDNMHKAIKAGAFMPPPPGSWVCSKEWCGYANICPKFKKR